ncbi:MAG: alpha/beta hydrolase family protein [Gaiellaceae bacterium]
MRRLAVTLLLMSACAFVGAGAAAAPPLLRVELHLAPDATRRPHVVLMTLGGRIYCGFLLPLAEALDATRLCPDYGRNGETTGATRDLRIEDWGDPRYLAAVAQLPDRLRRNGVKISKLVVIGPSYAGYANAELVATHPETRPDALVVIDSYLDLPARYRALAPTHQTRKEMEQVIGGMLAQSPAAYAARSPSHHLDGLADAMRRGMKLIDVWSIAPSEKHEFNGATCQRAADAEWLARLATLLGRPVTGYVTHMAHADVLRNWGEHLLAAAGVRAPFATPLPARAVKFQPTRPPPAGSWC